ncbi:MAG: formate dehydrogenase accessory protein FdhE [Bacillota bacterium]|nr:formate dehydrogenase accessory protein FdhE [Bacillota bacterium]MDP4159289.1 formate dehydrogenase accessory protein FdhE [Bacillota bacterium]
MDSIKHLIDNTGEKSMQVAYQTYSLFKREVGRWRDERGSYWAKNLIPAESPPYYPRQSLPEKAIFELWNRLNRVVGLNVSQADLEQKWEEFKDSQFLQDSKLLSCLQIAISGVARITRETNSNLRDFPLESCSESSDCPFCGERAGVSVLIPPSGHRLLHCSLCGHEWPTKRIGCIRCGGEEASKQNYLRAEEFPGVELVVCEGCGHYFKEWDLRVHHVDDFIWEDVKTLALNYAAEEWVARTLKA